MKSINETIDEIIRHWDNYAPEFDEAHATENLDEWQKMLKSFLGEEKKNVLDLGTGTGFLAKVAAQLGHTCTGVDMSKKMMDIGRDDAKRNGLNITFIESPVEKLPFEDGFFDALINCRLIWTLVNPQTAFTEWRRVLKTGGQILNFIRIKDGNDTDIKEVYGETIDSALPLKNAGKDKMTAALENAGFTHCEAIQLHGELTFKADMPPWYAIRGIR
jgi:ubiquinone/menaquinone biosynthesis C-methylase UbiE